MSSNDKKKITSKSSFAEDSFDLIDVHKEREKLVSSKRTKKKKLVVELLNLQIFLALLVIVGLIFTLYKSLMNTATIKHISATTQDVTQTKLETAVTIKDEFQEIEFLEFEFIETLDVEEEIELIENEEILELQNIFSNNEIIGYLKIDGTSILYPVAQTIDNDFYLEHDLYKNENSSGSLFMDFENQIPSSNAVFPVDKNNIIYGHNMKDGTQFHNLRFYIDYQYYVANKYIELTTLYSETKWEVFSFYETDTEFNYTNTNFKTDEIYRDFLQEVVNKSLYQTDCEISFEDTILTLSTCTNEDDKRYVLTAKLIHYTTIEKEEI